MEGCEWVAARATAAAEGVPERGPRAVLVLRIPSAPPRPCVPGPPHRAPTPHHYTVSRAGDAPGRARGARLWEAGAAHDHTRGAPICCSRRRPLSLSTFPLLPSPNSESVPSGAADSDAEAADNHRTSTFRLHEGTSHPSRADNVDDLHRLQKSVTKARHDGEGERKRKERKPGVECGMDGQRGPPLPVALTPRSLSLLSLLAHAQRTPTSGRSRLCPRPSSRRPGCELEKRERERERKGADKPWACSSPAPLFSIPSPHLSLSHPTPTPSKTGPAPASSRASASTWPAPTAPSPAASPPRPAPPPPRPASCGRCRTPA